MEAETMFPTRNRRFTFHKPLRATFRSVLLTVHDLSERGARVVHQAPLIVGLRGTMDVEVPPSGATLLLKARVVWSRAHTDGRLESGLRIIDERPDRAADLLDHLVRLGWAGNPGARAAKNKLRGSECDFRAARQALDFLTKNRSASARWKHLVERDLTTSNGYPVEVVAAWELLGRSIDVELVAQAHREREPFVLDAETLFIDDEVGFSLVET